MIRDIAIDPSGSSDQVIFIGTDSGGVWKSVDGGNTWQPKTDYMPSLNIGAVALDPLNPSLVYAGSGNAANQFTSSGAGIYKSTDGGETWTVLGATLLTNQSVARIVLPLSELLLVASTTGLFRSVDGGLHFGNNPPLFDNNGVILAGYITDLEVDTASASTVYASVYGAGVFKSTDGGVTFPSSGNLFTSNNGSPTAPGYIRFAQSTRPDNSTLYVQAQLLADPASAGLFKSVDGGAHWNRIPVNTSDFEAAQVGYAQTVGVDPQDANRVFFGARALYMATDGGANGITAANRIDLSKVHADQHALVFSPVSHFTGFPPTRVYNGTDGGIATTANPGPNANWTCLNGSASCSVANGAIATVLLRQIDFGRGSADNNRYTYGVAQDLGVCSSQANCAGTLWLYGDGGDGSSIAADPLNPQHAISIIGEGFTSTSNGGQSWTRGAGGLPASMQMTYFDPNGKTAYVVGNLNQLYQSKDNGANFTLINTFPARVTAINMAVLDSNTIWVGLIDGTLQRTANALAGANSTWTAYTIANGPGQTQVWGLAVDPANTDDVVAVYRSASGSAFHTVDGGNTWARISDSLNSLPLNAVVIDPNTSPHTVIVATDTGVLSTRNLGANWAPLGVGLPNVHCTSLALDSSAIPSVLRVGTYGRSTFELAYQRVYVDWRNSTTTQDGTLSHPFRTVLQGVNAPSNGGARYVNVEAGDYFEGPITYNQCGTLNALNGPVTIH